MEKDLHADEVANETGGLVYTALSLTPDFNRFRGA